MREPVERHGGTVEKFVGDAVMAVFGIPQLHEDDALRAVRAAVEMRTELARLNAELPGRRRAELQIRIGINTGEVVTGDGTTTLVTGDAVNTAKRLEQSAGADEILIGDTTRRLVANATELEPAAPIAAKGKRRPVDAWRGARCDPRVRRGALRGDPPHARDARGAATARRAARGRSLGAADLPRPARVRRRVEQRVAHPAALPRAARAARRSAPLARRLADARAAVGRRVAAPPRRARRGMAAPARRAETDRGRSRRQPTLRRADGRDARRARHGDRGDA